VLTAKKKIVKRDAGNESGFSYATVQAFFLKYGKIVGGVVAGIVIIGVALYFYEAGKTEDNLQASRMLAKVQTLYQQGQYKLAISGDPSRGIPGLEDIAVKYDNTPTGQQAMLYLGDCYLYTEQYDKAISTFDNASPSSDLMKAAVAAGIATAQYDKGDYAKAAEFYEDAATTYQNDLLSADRFLHAAEAYLKAGKKDRAKEMLEQVKKAKTTKFASDITRLTAEYNINLD